MSTRLRRHLYALAALVTASAALLGGAAAWRLVQDDATGGHRAADPIAGAAGGEQGALPASDTRVPNRDPEQRSNQTPGGSDGHGDSGYGSARTSVGDLSTADMIRLLATSEQAGQAASGGHRAGSTMTADPGSDGGDPSAPSIDAPDPAANADPRASAPPAPEDSAGLAAARHGLLRPGRSAALGHSDPDDPSLPGRARPAMPAEPTTLHIVWDSDHGDRSSEIIVSPGSGLRRPAIVRTFDAGGKLLVQHEATAFYDATGELHIDSRDRPVKGPYIANGGRWSPDSFAVDAYGSTRIVDDINQAGGGWRR